MKKIKPYLQTAAVALCVIYLVHHLPYDLRRVITGEDKQADATLAKVRELSESTAKP